MPELEIDPLLRGHSARGPAGPCAGLRLPPVHPNMISVVICAAISGFCFGYEIGIIDTVLAMPSFRAWSHTRPGIDADAPETTGWIVSTFLFGCIGGSIAVSWLADAIGRKRCILLGALLFSLGGAGQASAPALGVLYAMRVLSGCSIGVLSMVAPLYISETSPTSVRGSLIAVQQLLITFGVLFASCVNAIIYATGGGSGDVQWRAALAVQILPGAVLFCVMFATPLSPRWLLQRGRVAEATAVVVHLRGATSSDDPAVSAEITEMKAGIDEERREGSDEKGCCGAWRDLFHPRVRWPLFLACALQVAQQVSRRS
jgi:MFS transporter, SP family, sugar:H+ symporter